MLTTIDTVPLFQTDLQVRTSGLFPKTRYQGSKLKLLEWIKYHTEKLSFNTVLDAFGGTGSVSYLFKQMGKQVTYNDYLKFNGIIAKALIVNDYTRLSQSTIQFILTRHAGVKYSSFIEDNFRDVYFTDEENHWLDQTVANIQLVENEYEQAIAYFALFQACISKRPYNLFHRKNLYVRTSEVERSFGNKTTWDKPFDVAFEKFANEANRAVFSNGYNHQTLTEDVMKLNVTTPDLVYIDSPYISPNGVGTDYLDFYHFLEGLVNYQEWKFLIDSKSKHLKFKSKTNVWSDKKTITEAFYQLFRKFNSSTLVISYRDDGIPSVPELVSMLEALGKKVSIEHAEYQYALSITKNREVLIIAT
jgi:adenine-specific DNA-methyltransferase